MWIGAQGSCLGQQVSCDESMTALARMAALGSGQARQTSFSPSPLQSLARTPTRPTMLSLACGDIEMLPWCMWDQLSLQWVSVAGGCSCPTVKSSLVHSTK